MPRSRGTAAAAGASGAEAIAKLFAMTTRRYPEHGNTPRTRHLVLNPIVEISPERTASARSTFCVIQNTETVPLQPIVVGRYFDTFSCDDDGWYFTDRQVDVEMIGDISAHLMFDPRDFDRSNGATLSASTLMYRVLGGRRPPCSGTRDDGARARTHAEHL